MSRRIQFVCLFVFLSLLSTAPQSGLAQNAPTQNPLSFGNNIFVTGDYVVAGAQGMTSHLQNGFATGTITIPDANPGITGTTSVPQGAQIVGALLYWQTVEKVGQPGSGQNGFFGPVINGVPQTYAIRGAIPGGQNTVTFSNGGCSGGSTGKILRTYRADVRGALPQDANGNVIVNPIGANGKPNGVYQVRLPSVGSQTPLTLGATLVIIYRVMSPNVPLNSIVIYDGDFAPGTSNLTMTQTMQGFYDAAKSPISRLTHIVGSGQSNKFETVFLNNVPLPSLYKNNQPAFPGFYGTWDNPTWTFGGANGIALANPVHEDDFVATTQVIPSTSNQGCVSWGATILSTTVKNNDNDGLLDSWKAAHGYCDASINEGVCTTGNTNTGWVPLPGATKGKKDLFVQLDYMCGIVNANGTCDTVNGESFDPRLTVDPSDSNKNPLDKLVAAFANNPNNPINLHIFPKYAIDERDPNVTCIDSSGQPLCVFPNQPGVVGWPTGVVFLQNQLVDPNGNASVCTLQPTPANCFPRFLHGMKDSWHYALFGRSLGLPNWTFGAGTLTNVTQSGKTVTFTTSIAPSLFPDGSCPQGRVTVAFAITNANLDGTFCATPVGQNGFSIQVGNSATATYTVATDPNLAVASSQADAVSGFSDIGGEHSVVTLGSWGADGQTWQAKTGTFMHELGHSLGLTHGGLYFKANNSNDFTPTVEANCKPNNQSVMNYMFQVDLLQKPTGQKDANGNPLYMQVPDYSRESLPTLNEANGAVSGTLPSSILYPNTGLFIPFSGQGSPVSPHCDGTPISDGAQVSYTTPARQSLSFSMGQDINFDGNTSEVLDGHNDWVGTATVPGVDLRQIGATGSLSAAGGLIGLGGGGGLTGLGGGGGLTGLGGGGGLIGLGGGGGLTGLGGGGGLTGLGGGGGIPELTRAAANAYTRPPQNLTATEAASSRTITLNWFRPTFGQIGAYNVYRSEAGGPFTFLKTVPVVNNPQSISTSDTVTCNPAGFRYEVSALLAPNNTQESVPSNTVNTGSNGPVSGQGALTGCYTVSAFSSPANAVHGSIVPITWTLQDDFNTMNFPVNRSAANSSLVAIGPVPNSCGLTGSPTILLNGTPTPQSGASTFPPASGGQFTFNWDTDGFCAGSYTFRLTLDSGQTQTTTSALQLQIDVTDTDSTPHVTTTSLPDATVGGSYSKTLTQDGGIGAITWSVSGTLPPGIVFNPGTHTLLGTPIVPPPGGLNFTAQLYTFTVQVTDSAGNSGTQMLTLRTITAVSLSRVDNPIGVGPIGLIAADFNGDGKPDLASANSRNNTVSVLLSNGDGTFTSKPTLATGSAPYALAAGDFDGDGKLDLAVTNSANGMPNTVSIFLGNGDGTFQAPSTYAVGSGPISVITGDFNGDGKLDLAVANQNDHSVSILLGNGDGTFQAHVDYPAGTTDVAAVAFGDFNGDGKLDLAVSNPSDDTVSVLLGNGDGTFGTPVAYPTGNSGDHPIAVSAVDLNGDGKVDLAVTNLNAKTVAILLGNGDGTFKAKVTYPTTIGAFIGPSAMTPGDFNGDGKVDLAITDQIDNSVSILLGNGDGTFQSPLEFTTGSIATGVAAGDFNGDGRLDLAVANFNSNTVSILLHLPQPATNLVVSGVTTGQVGLSWTSSLSTGIAGYNVYRGTTSGGPYAKINSGVVTASGFTDLAVVSGTTYFYVVTTVDTGGLESMFSNEVSATAP